MSIKKCPRCGRAIYRIPRRWFERIMLIKAAYRCGRCRRRRYRPKLSRNII